MQGHILIILLLVYRITSLHTCKDGYILRHKWKNRTTIEEYCCFKVPKNCSPGTYVEKCTSDLGSDVCLPCPGSTWLPDETNSTTVADCIFYSCSAEAVRVDYLPKSGCRLPCVCDIERKFYGLDSCNCKVFEGNCPSNTKLTLYGTCLPHRDADQMNNLRPDNNAVIIPISNKNGSNDITSSESDVFTNEKLIITVVSVVIFILILVTVIVLRRQKQGQIGQSEEDKVERSCTDSGISLTGSSIVPEENADVQQPLLTSQQQQAHLSSQEQRASENNSVITSDQTETNVNVGQIDSEHTEQISVLMSIGEQEEIVTGGNQSKPKPILMLRVLPLRSEKDVTATTRGNVEEIEDQNLVQNLSAPSSPTHNYIYVQRPPQVEDYQTYNEFVNVEYDFGPQLLFTTSVPNLAV